MNTSLIVAAGVLCVACLAGGCATTPKMDKADVTTTHPALLAALTAVARPDEIPAAPDLNTDALLAPDADFGDLVEARSRSAQHIPGFAVRGNVSKPGLYVLDDGMTADVAVKRAGWVDPGPMSATTVEIMRHSVGIHFEPKRGREEQIKDGDVIHVRVHHPVEDKRNLEPRPAAYRR